MEPRWIYRFDDFRLDPVLRILSNTAGQRLQLKSRALDLLVWFVQHPDELLSKQSLMAAVWPDTVVEENNLNQSIGAIRRVLNENARDNKFIVTVPGRGYRFVAIVTRVEESNSVDESRVAGDSPAGSATNAGRRRLAFALVALLMTATGLYVARPILLSAPETKAGQETKIQSIAVIPFENHSEGPENAYFAEGVQGEILTLLSRIGTLRVIGRSSIDRYTRSHADLSQIAAELGVTHVLRGSVQKAGASVRVNVQLLDVVADKQLWAETYDRKIADVFAVESEVAQAIANSLHAKLSGAEQRELAARPTQSPEAYDAYLRGRAYSERLTRTEFDALEAIAAFEEAVRLDPAFAVAWARLSRRHANLVSLSYDRSTARKNAARDALAKAIQLQPQLVETRLAQGYFLFRVELDFEQAESILAQIHAAWPHNADATMGLAQLTREEGRWTESLPYYQNVIRLDPQNPYQHALLCDDYLSARQFSLALKSCDRALDLAHADVGALTVKAATYQALGEFERAGALLAGLLPAPSDSRALTVLSYQAVLQGSYPTAIATLQTYLANPEALGSWLGVNRRSLADLQQLAGDATAARATYELARAESLKELQRQPENSPLAANLGLICAALGERSDAFLYARQSIALAKKEKRESLIARSEETMARIEARFGDKDAAVERLRALLSATGGFPPITPALLRADPAWDPLRSDPRFAQLLSATQ